MNTKHSVKSLRFDPPQWESLKWESTPEKQEHIWLTLIVIDWDEVAKICSTKDVLNRGSWGRAVSAEIMSVECQVRWHINIAAEARVEELGDREIQAVSIAMRPGLSLVSRLFFATQSNATRPGLNSASRLFFVTQFRYSCISYEIQN